MQKYLIEASYTSEGAKGLLKDGGTKREKAADAAIKSTGGRMEAFYFAFGENDAVILAEAPDHASIAAACIAINASGAVTTRTTVLLTPAEIDKAVKKTVSYTPPGK